MHIETELLAAEQEAAKELMRKQEALRQAQAQRSLEEAAQRVCKEEAWEEAECQVQEEAQKAWEAQEAQEVQEMQEAQEVWEVARHRALEENKMIAHPEEDGDYGAVHLVTVTFVQWLCSGKISLLNFLKFRQLKNQFLDYFWTIIC